MPTTNSSMETASTLTIGAIGIIIPQFVQNWATFILTIASLLWVTIQIIDKLRKWNKKD